MGAMQPVSRRLLFSVVVLAGFAHAGSITDAERKTVLDYLERTRTKLLEETSNLTAEQWRFKSSPDRWSIAECVEHIAVTEQSILARLKMSLKEEAPAKLDTKKDAVLMRFMPDRSRKATAPEEVAPKSRFATAAEAIAFFEKARAATTTYATSTQDDLRAHGFPHFAFGDLDAYQWLILLPAHCERHTKQILEVKADPAFPKP